MRRALAIDETSLGKDHSGRRDPPQQPRRVAAGTNRSIEAEPLMLRALAIFLAFQRDTGHVHPERGARTANHHGLLAALGKSEADIDAELATLWREAGLDKDPA